MKSLVQFCFYSLLSFSALFILSACGSSEPNDPQAAVCFSNTSSTDLKNDEFYIYNSISRSGRDGLKVRINIHLGLFPISRGNPRNDIDLKDGESIELIVDGQTYPLSESFDLPSNIIQSPCVQGVARYTTSFTPEQKIAFAAQLRIRRNSENDIVSDFELPFLLDVIEPTAILETYNPTTDSLFFSWINNLTGEIKLELRDSLFCYEIVETVPAGEQQYSIIAGTDLDRLSPSCEQERDVTVRLTSFGTDLDVSSNLPNEHTLFTSNLNILIEVAERLVY